MSKEPEGFRDFVDACSPALLRTAWMLTGNAASAEDLLQTALAKTWPHWDRVAVGNPSAYVRKVMVRTNVSWSARFWTRERPSSDPGEHVAPQGSSVDETATVHERVVVAAALAALPTRQRQAVVLRFFDDLSVEAVAEAMGTTPGTVKSQCAKGLAKLRDLLQENPSFEGEPR